MKYDQREHYTILSGSTWNSNHYIPALRLGTWEIPYRPIHHFQNAKRKISDEAIDFILIWTRQHTYYTQVICNTLFGSGLKNITIGNTKECCKKVLDEQEDVIRNKLSTNCTRNSTDSLPIQRFQLNTPQPPLHSLSWWNRSFCSQSNRAYLF